MKVALIAKPGHLDTGVGRYTAQLQSALESSGIQVILVHPINPLPAGLQRLLKRWLRIDVQNFFDNYPIWARYPPADIYHLTSQNLATLMFFRHPPGKTVITVHDLIPWLTRMDPELRVYRTAIEAGFDRLALLGLQRSDAILADSQFTRQAIEQLLKKHLPRVSVAPLGVYYVQDKSRKDA